MREQLAAKPQSGSHPCGLAAEIPPYAEGVQDPQEPSGIENGHCSMPMTLVQRLPGLQKAPGVRNGLSYLMDGARTLLLLSVISTFITKSLLTILRKLHILTVRKLMFPFYRGNPPPVLVGGCLIFYIATQRGQTRYAAQIYLH